MSIRMILGAAVVAGSIGCGAGGNKPVPVEGIITIDGKPLTGASVQFLPKEGGRPATGPTNSEGRFVLTTTNTGDGAMPGAYKVLVTKQIVPTALEGAKPPEYGPQASANLGKQMKATAEKTVKEKSLEVPKIYSDAASTPLTWTIPPEGDKNVKFNLDSKLKK